MKLNEIPHFKFIILRSLLNKLETKVIRFLQIQKQLASHDGAKFVDPNLVFEDCEGNDVSNTLSNEEMMV